MTLHEVKESLRLAFGTFRAHKLRSFLTILGVLVGVFTIIAVVSVITGLNNSIARDIESLGSNTLYVSKYKPGIVLGNRPASERNRKGITFEDAQAIQKACPAIVAVSPQNYYRKPGGNIIKYKDRDVSRPAFFGTLPDYEIVNNAIVDRGRFINDSDVKFRTMVTVIGSDVGKELFPSEDPINKVVQINDRKFTVIGVLEEKETIAGGGENRFALIPYGTFKKIHPEEKELWLALKATSPELLPPAIDQVTELMRRRRGLNYNEPNDFAVFTQENLLEIWDQITSAVWFVMIIISSIGLLVGGVGVMNIMLVSVTERTKEIGIRKAIGARRRNILWQFLIEAMALSGFGGVLGIVLGLAAGQLIGAVTPLPADISIPWIILAFCFSVGVALVFGIYPAARASRLDPIECLRYE
ncbi:MAG: ABC transporter permease [Candidatus Zixiibacteriota bacterium]|nr:MAG: ABC transporter permease [candidate division Zixibacteria bacterium]